MAIDVMRFGPQRDLRKVRQYFKRATPRSTGARAAAGARSTVFSAEVSPRRGLRSMPVVSQRATALVGGIGREGDALALADAMRWVRAGEGRSCARPGRRGWETQRPAVRIGDHSHVRSVPAVLVGVVRA